MAKALLSLKLARPEIAVLEAIKKETRREVVLTPGFLNCQRLS